jgi:hypothetical protein
MLGCLSSFLDATMFSFTSIVYPYIRMQGKGEKAICTEGVWLSIAETFTEVWFGMDLLVNWA